MPRFDLTTCLVAGILALNGPPAFANPFSKPYVVALQEITLDGDLWLPSPLSKFTLADGLGVEVWIEHRQDNIGYGDVRSQLILHPFVTGLFADSPKKTVWTRPGGGEVIFRDTDEKNKSTQTNAVNAAPVEWGPVLRRFYNNGVELWTYEGNRHLVLDADWKLLYQNGGLKEVLTPSGAALRITSSGMRVHSIVHHDRVLASVDWLPNLSPTSLVIADKTYRFTSDAKRSAWDVSVDGLPVYRFQFSHNGLLESIQPHPGDLVEIEWAENRGSAYPLPFHLTRLGATHFEYERDGEYISIRAKRPHAPGHSLKATMRYGTLVSVHAD